MALPQSVYIERWEQVLRVLESMSQHDREKHFDMGFWGEKTPCGTVGCAAGHCSLDPWFIERGFSSIFKKDTVHEWVNGKLVSREGLFLDFNQSDPSDFFGYTGYEKIFLSRGTHAQIVGKVKRYIDFLKAGGEANYDGEEFDDDFDDDEDDDD